MGNSKRRSPRVGLKQHPEVIHIRVLSDAVAPLINLYPWAKVIAGHLRARRWPDLLVWAGQVSPTEYRGRVAEYFAAVQVSSLIRKYPFSSQQIPGLNPQRTAEEKFRASEHRCRRVNAKFRLRANRTYRHAKHERLFSRARSYIRRVLGDKPDYKRVYDQCDFTEGASIGVHGSTTNLARKLLAGKWSCTPMAYKFALPALWANAQIHDILHAEGWKGFSPKSFEAWVKRKVELVSYNKLSFVPKTALTHRVIAVEPLLNGFLQKGIDTLIRFLLRKRMGIDLSDQTRNQRLAYVGSLGGTDPYVTLDLSAASYSIAYWLVKFLVPEEWFAFMVDCRSPSFSLQGKVSPYEKFCSMGNGFCFPLESLIFAALAYSASDACEGVDPYDFSIYGDDIIVRQSVALLLTELLKEAGFQLNEEKSFIVGTFRESCGADWDAGQDVRPVIMDEPICDIRQVFALHNSFLRSPGTEAFSQRIREGLIDVAEETHRGYFRPGREPGDTCFSVPLDRAMTSQRVTLPRPPRQVGHPWFGKFVKKSEQRRPLRDEQPFVATWRWEEILSLPVVDDELEENAQSGLEHVKAMAVLKGASSEKPFSLRYLSTPALVHVSRPWKDEHESAALLRNCKTDRYWYEQGSRWCPFSKRWYKPLRAA